MYESNTYLNSQNNFQGGRKLLAEECFADGMETECAFHLSEAVASSVRTLAVYREEQLQNSGKYSCSSSKSFRSLQSGCDHLLNSVS